ncbi:MAG: GNAT family N-acetyltransferase [Bacteroidetes bacterium]|nr:GNAT family N-acetyltransferase [Bacteroidota bacterium]
MKPIVSPLTPGIIHLIRLTHLPSDDLGDHIRFFTITENNQIIGVAGLEPAGSDALLRSVAVHPDWQNRGIGKVLTDEMVAQARQSGYQSLWLLTTTAERFFLRYGFEKTDRMKAPEAIRQTSEFKSVCPSSAACMKLDLTP